MAVREYRQKIQSWMPNWYSDELDLHTYFVIPENLIFTLKINSILVTNGVIFKNYDRLIDTLGTLKNDFSLTSSGDYDHCLVDIIEKVKDQNVYIYTNDNIAVLDAIGSVFDSLKKNEAEYKKSLNMLHATRETISFWESFFQSKRIFGESDKYYMKRVFISLLAQKINNITIEETLSNLFTEIQSVFYIENSVKRDANYDYTVDIWSKIKESEIPLLEQSIEMMIAAGVWHRLIIEIPKSGYGCCYGLEFGDT